MQELFMEAQKRKTCFALVQEPYVGDEGEIKITQSMRIIQSAKPRTKPVKSAIIVFNGEIDIIEDPTLTTENIAVAILKTNVWRIAVISIYFEDSAPIEPYLRQIKAIKEKLNETKIIIGGDANAWSHWWGSVREDPRGQELFDALNDMELHILNQGNEPTFDTIRGGRQFRSHVDVTMCSDGLLCDIHDWKVDKGITSSDHNALTFSIQLNKHDPQTQIKSTRRYNTKKADWEKFKTELKEYIHKKDINVDKINRINTKEELHLEIEKYIDSVRQASEKSIPPKKITNKYTLPWWTERLENLKRDMVTKKRRIKCAAVRRRPHVIDQYLQAKDLYEQEATQAQTTSWKEFCGKQDRESMWDGIYRVVGRTSKRHQDQPLVDNGKALTPEESVKLLATTFFPDDVETEDQDVHKLMRAKARKISDPLPNDLQDPPFTMSELTFVAKSFNPKKAPGPDGFTADICAETIRTTGEIFLALINKCLELSCFPEPWKEAYVVVLRKPGKDDYAKPKSYRPIGLLSILGKIFEKMMVRRIRWHILPKSNPRQYGFVPQRCTEDSLYDLCQHIKDNLRKKLINVIVSLDIEGAFDSAWWPAIKCRLLNKRLPQNLRGLVENYLEDRKVTVGYLGQQYQKPTTKGCVQGSIGGPTFWNVLLDPLLDELEESGTYCQAFADDIVLVFSGSTALEIESQANPILARVNEWGLNNKLRFAAHKTNAMLVTKRLKYDTPRINMAGTEIIMVEDIKILGLTIDHKLSFEKHVTNICRKATNLYKQLARAAKISWGLGPEIIRTIYVAVVEPIILYAASVWAEASDRIGIQKHLNVVQRGFAQKICKAYRTTSLNAALVLSGLLPLDLRIKENAKLYEAKRGKPQEILGDRKVEEKTCYLKALHPARETDVSFTHLEDMEPHTIANNRIEGPSIYTDGSKIDGKVGAALTLWQNGAEVKMKKYKLEPFCTVYQAEMYALHQAIDMASEIEGNTVNILSDSRSALETLQNRISFHPIAFNIKKKISELKNEGKNLRLFWIRAHVGTVGNERADELAKQAAHKKTRADYSNCPPSFIKRSIRQNSLHEWNERYIKGETAAVTKLFLPNAILAYKIIRKINLTPLLVQVLTGHGGFAQYLHKFKIKDSPACTCDPAKEESVIHLIVECPQFGTERHDLEQRINNKIDKDTLWEMLAGKYRNQFIDFCTKVTKYAIKRNKT
ncbi:hypothetical protein O0L34_g12863 [Tuta absoluta]|nr:hypothetical protein O0L34_g12863 [Tuta absoluta]